MWTKHDSMQWLKLTGALAVLMAVYCLVLYRDWEFALTGAGTVVVVLFVTFVAVHAIVRRRF